MVLTSVAGMVVDFHVAGCCCCWWWQSVAKTGRSFDSPMGEKVDMALTSAAGTYRC